VEDPRLSVLVVDDDPDIRFIVSEALAEEGYAVVEAPHGQAALDIVRARPVAAVLLDMKMPVMDGWQFVRQYAEVAVDKAPIIVVTAAQDAARRSAEIEADGYLAKPFSIDDLLRVVDDHLCVC
jgi:CheY-like chemotaxis protein